MILEKSRRRRVGAAVMALALGALALAGCNSGRATPGVIDVVGAEVQYGDVLAQIGGRYVNVDSLMTSPSTDPHNFEASPRVAQLLATAQLVVQNGAGYDAFMNTLEAASASPSRVVLSVAAMLDRRTAVNPHFWYAPSTMPVVARFVATSLAKIAPQHASYFHARELRFVGQWRRVSAALAAARRAVGGDRVASTEPVGDYLIDAMGLVNLTPFRFQADVMNGIDPSPQDIVTQDNLIARHQIVALVYNAQVSSPLTQSMRELARHDHVAVVPLYEIMPAHEHVQTWILSTIAALVAASSTRGRS